MHSVAVLAILYRDQHPSIRDVSDDEPEVELHDSSDPSDDVPDLEDTLSPAVRRLAKQYHVDTTQIRGSGPSGRIRVGDVMEYLGNRAIPAGQSAADVELAAGIKESSRLSVARSAPHRAADQVQPSTTVFECCMSAVLADQAATRALNRELELTVYYLSACGRALRTVPEMAGGKLPAAVGLSLEEREPDAGLPVLPKMDLMDTVMIAEALRNIDALDERVAAFTFCQHGASGSLLAGPAGLMEGQVANLGVGKLQKRPVVREVAGQETLQTLPMCYVNLTFDARAVDIHKANRFLQTFVATLERWPQ